MQLSSFMLIQIICFPFVLLSCLAFLLLSPAMKNRERMRIATAKGKEYLFPELTHDVIAQARYECREATASQRFLLSLFVPLFLIGWIIEYSTSHSPMTLLLVASAYLLSFALLCIFLACFIGVQKPKTTCTSYCPECVTTFQNAVCNLLCGAFVLAGAAMLCIAIQVQIA